MAGSIFRILNVDYDDKEHVHLVMLQLCSINDEIKALLAEQKAQFGNDDSLITLGHILERAGQLDLAETCYLNELNKMLTWDNYGFDERNIAVCYHSLANIALRKRDYVKSLDFFEKALKKNEQLLPAGHDLIADCYRSVGSMHGVMGNTDQALGFLEIALAMFRTNHSELHAHVASCLHDMGTAHLHRSMNDSTADHSAALEYFEKALHIKEQTLPKYHSSLATTLFNLAGLYRACNQWDKALSYYKHSLEIKLKSFPDSHPCIIENYHAIAAVCRKKSDHEGAAQYYQQAKQCEANSLRLKYPDAAEIKFKISSSSEDETDD